MTLKFDFWLRSVVLLSRIWRNQSGGSQNGASTGQLLWLQEIVRECVNRFNQQIENPVIISHTAINTWQFCLKKKQFGNFMRKLKSTIVGIIDVKERYMLRTENTFKISGNNDWSHFIMWVKMLGSDYTVRDWTEIFVVAFIGADAGDVRSGQIRKSSVRGEKIRLSTNSFITCREYTWIKKEEKGRIKDWKS
jgi:hypothetical protein